jgi:hypothetical protein
VPVLRDDAERIESGGRAQDRADVVRIGNLVEHNERALVILALDQQIGEPHFVERLHFCD